MPDGTPCTCRECGITWTPAKGTGRNPVWCPDHRGQRVTPTLGAEMCCPQCGDRFAKQYANQRYCSKRCARRSEDARKVVRTLICDWCGVAFQRQSTGPRYQFTACSKSCAAAYSTCVLRGQSFQPWSPPKPTPKPKSPRARFAYGTCPQCGDSFMQDLRITTTTLYCSLKCGDKAGKDRRRARKRDAYVADVWRPRIFKRDGYRCQICGGKLAMGKSVPHPKAPTIDHIIPLAEGGTHEPANCQAAHFKCNAIKSNSTAPGGDQLLLIG